jgi:hypothetical protein
VLLLLISGLSDHLCFVHEASVAQLQSHTSTPIIVCDNFQQLANYLSVHYNLPQPSSFNNCLLLYFSLISLIDHYF